jgi:hypothetical protein
MPITLIDRTRSCTGSSGFAWRNHHPDIVTMLRDRLMGGRATVATVGDDFLYLFIDLRQQRSRLGRVVRILVGE